MQCLYMEASNTKPVVSPFNVYTLNNIGMHLDGSRLSLSYADDIFCIARGSIGKEIQEGYPAN